MNNFREDFPQHRPNRKVCKKYTYYLKTLRADFKQRCGYCNDSDMLRIRSFTIDHFVPRNPEGWTHTIEDNYYYNLIYSCHYCNSAKTNKWPTKDATIYNDGVSGFINPCTQEYNNSFQRSVSGKIIPRSQNDQLAKHIITELKLWLPIHEKMWKLERIKTLNEAIRNKLTKMPDNNLKKILEEIHYTILQTLDEVQSSIFVENN